MHPDLIEMFLWARFGNFLADLRPAGVIVSLLLIAKPQLLERLNQWRTAGYRRAI